MVKTMFYHYSQNNSGGSFVFDEDGISHHVIIEAGSASEANAIAERIGLYFDGEGDCDCCGSRWDNVYGEGDEVPMVYGTPVEPNSVFPEKKTGGWSPMKWMENTPEGFIHYLNGTVSPFWR